MNRYIEGWAQHDDFEFESHQKSPLILELVTGITIG